MKKNNTILLVIAIFCTLNQYAQHHSSITVALNSEKQQLTVQQELTYFNASNDTISNIILNDWTNAYSSKDTPLAKRFSDEFIRSFHLAKKEARGGTYDLTITDQRKQFVNWSRTDDQLDLVEVELEKKIAPNEKVTLSLTYLVKIPSDEFTKYGYGEKGNIYLKNWYLTPALYQDGSFVRYSNDNADDIANALSDFDIEMTVPNELKLFSDLNTNNPITNNNKATYLLSDKGRTDFTIFISPHNNFEKYKNDVVEVVTDLKDNNLNSIQKALSIDKIVRFVEQNIGKFPHQKVTVAQADYEKNPFYGLNQLPAFLSPFTNDFIYEIKFLKTYLNNYLKNSLRLDARKDNWIYDGIQIYTMMKYIDENYPDVKMMGSVSTFWLLKNYNLTNLPFNEQYSYFYMLMARKNLDQPLGAPKSALIKFNEQIANKYRAGLSFRYLANYIETENIEKSIRQFYDLNQTKNHTSRQDFETILKQQTPKNIDWFFNTIIDSRAIVDYKFGTVSKTKDSVSFTIKNKTQTYVPIPVYGIKNKEIVFKKWIESTSSDSTYTLPRADATKIVLNYKNEVPEYNLRNNWHSLKDFKISNRPVKFVVMKDLEDPYYNQILYVPTLVFNLYDGISPGLRFHNKTILDKPFIFDVNPTYSSKTQSLIGNFSFGINQNNRDSNLYNIRYMISGSYFHYAPDAAYFRFNPGIFIRFREDDFRDNRKQLILLRNVFVNKDTYELNSVDEPTKYNVFNAKYINTKSEATQHFNFITDFQLSNSFGKTAIELEFRRLFNNNRQLNLRFFAGSFLYNKTNSDYFSFALDRPTDYLFDYNYYGRSETSGFFSQQTILADGAFKSKLDVAFANQWITTANVSFNVWNWVEVYGDLGFVKNKFQKEKFVYDNGIRLNLVTDYFEFYFPVYSNNGWEIAQSNYAEKIRFIMTIDPRILVNLFTRKWF